MRPYLGNVEQSPTKGLSSLRLHDLNIQLPDRVLAPSNSIPEIFSMVISIGTSLLLGFFSRGEAGMASLGTEMEFAVSGAPRAVDELEGVNAKAGYAADGVGKTAAAKEMHQGVYTLGLVDVKVPELRTLDHLVIIANSGNSPWWHQVGW